MKEAITLQLVQVRIRNKAGLQRMSPGLRGKAHPFTFHSLKSMKVPIDDINTKQKFLQWIWTYGGPGRWQVRAPCPNKHARGGMSMKAIADATLDPDPRNEWKFTLLSFEERRLSRYEKILGWRN